MSQAAGRRKAQTGSRGPQRQQGESVPDVAETPEPETPETEPETPEAEPEVPEEAPAGTVRHDGYVVALRQRAEALSRESLSLSLAADMLQAHDETGINLGTWPAAKAFVEVLVGVPIESNGV